MALKMYSPSSINTYKQCPRKFFYQYILRLPTKPSIHLVRGSIAHETLEDFFGIDIQRHDSKDKLTKEILTIHKSKWIAYKQKLLELNMDRGEMRTYIDDTTMMIVNWANRFMNRMDEKMQKGLSFHDAFKALTPIVEAKYADENLRVLGFIDAIEKEDGEVRIVDYKTSKKFEITDDYRLQLAIYALLYRLRHNELPHKVGLYFFKHNDHLFLDVDDMLLEFAKEQIEHVQKNTISESIDDYEKKESGLCKWSTGQCDFYDACFKQQRLDYL